MKIKKIYSKPDIDEHFVDRLISLWAGSGITPPILPSSKTSPKDPSFITPSAVDYPFGGDSPDYTNM